MDIKDKLILVQCATIMAELTVLRNEVLTEFKKNLSDNDKNLFSTAYEEKIKSERKRVISEMQKILNKHDNLDDLDDLFKDISAN